MQGRMRILGEVGKDWRPRNRYRGLYGNGYSSGNRFRGTYKKPYGTGLGLGSAFKGWKKGDWRNGVGFGGDWRRRRSCSYYVGGRRLEVASGEDVTVKGQRKTCVNGRLTGNLGLDYPSKYDGYRGYNRGYNRDYNRGYNRDYKRGYNANKVFNNVYSKNNIYNRYDDFGGIFDDYDYGRQQACGGKGLLIMDENRR